MSNDRGSGRRVSERDGRRGPSQRRDGAPLGPVELRARTLTMATKKQVNYAMHCLDAAAQWHGSGLVGGHVCRRDQSVD